MHRASCTSPQQVRVQTRALYSAHTTGVPALLQAATDAA